MASWSALHRVVRRQGWSWRVGERARRSMQMTGRPYRGAELGAALYAAWLLLRILAPGCWGARWRQRCGDRDDYADNRADEERCTICSKTRLVASMRPMALMPLRLWLAS